MAQPASSAAVGVAANSTFRDRVSYFRMKAAVAVMAEAAITVNHAARVAYAKLILAGSVSVDQYTIAVMTNATVAAAGIDATDGELEFTCNSLFDAFAGVSL